MQKVIRGALLPFIMLMVVLVCPAMAQAAQNTWLPQFNKDQHVYVDEKLSGNRTYPVQFDSDLERKLVDAGKQNNIQIYLVAVESGDETPPSGVKWGVFKLDEMLGKWQVRSDFPTQDYLVIMWVRYKNDPAHGSVAVNAGSRLKGYGMTGAHFDDPNGPVTPAVKTYMRNDPQTAFVTIVSNVNREVSATIQAEKDRAASEEFNKKLPGRIALGGCILVFIILLTWLIVRYRRERRKALKAIADWRESMDSANQQYIKLNDGYMGFLKDQGNWSEKFKGETLKRFKAAVTNFAEFTARQKAANRLADEADTHAKRCYFPLVGGYLKAQALLSTEPVVITGEELPLEVSTLFGGLVAKTTYDPDKLLEAMSDLFDRTNKGLSSIVTSFRGAEQNKKDIDTLLPEVQTARTALEANGLVFEPYNGRFTAIKTGVDGFIAILSSDPCSAFEGSEKVEADVRKLKADLERAVAIKVELAETEQTSFATVEAVKPKLLDAELVYEPYGTRMSAIKSDIERFRGVLLADPTTALRTYPGAAKYAGDVSAVKADMERAISLRAQLKTVSGEIDKAEKRAHEIRCRNLGYSYPLSSGETAASGSANALFTLVDTEGNPDPGIARAKSHLEQALAAVLAAELDRCDQERAESSSEAVEAYKLVDAVLAAKAFVERNVPEVRTNLGRLTGELDPAEGSVGELKSDFLAANYTGEPEKLDQARRQVDATPARLAAIKTAYDEQRFLACRASVEKLAGNVQSSRDRLTEIHSRLATLRQLRQHARDVTAATRAKANALATKLQTNAFTTSAATDGEFQRFNSALTAQEREVAQRVTDWPAAAQAADRLSGSHSAIDAAIDRERSEHQSATSKVSALASAISNAESYVNRSDTRQPARSKLSEARSALSNVEGQMRVAKSDWTVIGRRADEHVSLASAARDLAQSDERAADSARSAISRAESNISSVNRSYGHNVFADTSSAQSYLSSARSALGSRDYEGAQRQADNANRAADQAESDAQARVAAILAAIEAERRRREEEERRQREEEDRRRRQAEEDAERARRASESSSYSSSSSSSYDSGSSGGGSYDSGSSGGGSYSSGSGGSDY